MLLLLEGLQWNLIQNARCTLITDSVFANCSTQKAFCSLVTILGILTVNNKWRVKCWCPLLWAKRQHVCLPHSGPRFDSRSRQVSWVRFLQGFSSPVRQMSGSLRPPRSPNIIWPSLSSSLIIHYGRQWPEMLTCPKTLNIHTYP